MKLLAIESSGPAASAAVFEGEKLISEKSGPFKVTHSETLMPLISQALAEAGLKPADLDIIAVSGGPGSFTGLRIGSATAKGLGFALNKQLVHVPTLDAMAYNFRDGADVIVPIMDARRAQVYTGIYKFEGGGLKILMPGCPVAMDDVIKKLNDEYTFSHITFLGDGVPVHEERIAAALKCEYSFAEAPNDIQRAASVGLLALELIKEGKITDAAAEAPDYMRPSQAERVRAEQKGQIACKRT